MHLMRAISDVPRPIRDLLTRHRIGAPYDDLARLEIIGCALEAGPSSHRSIIAAYPHVWYANTAIHQRPYRLTWRSVWSHLPECSRRDRDSFCNYSRLSASSPSRPGISHFIRAGTGTVCRLAPDGVATQGRKARLSPASVPPP